MEIIKTRREILIDTASSSYPTVYMPPKLLNKVVEDLTLGKLVSCTGYINLVQQSELPASIISYSHTIPGSTTEVASTSWPVRIPSILCGSNVYFWYYDKDNIYWFTGASEVHGIPARISLQTVVFSDASAPDYMLINDGNGQWHVYFTSGGNLLFDDPNVTFDVWLIGGGAAGGGKSTTTGDPKANGQGGGGGGYRLSVYNCTPPSSLAMYVEIGQGGTATNTSTTGASGEATDIIYSTGSGTAYLTGDNDVECYVAGGAGGKAATSTKAGNGCAGGSGGGGGGGKSHDGGAGGTNGANGSAGSGGSSTEAGQTISGGTGGAGANSSGIGDTSGYAFGDSTFDGIRRGDGGHGGGGMNKAYSRTSGRANSGAGGSGANGYATTNTTAYYGGNGGSGLIILRSAS